MQLLDYATLEYADKYSRVMITIPPNDFGGLVNC